MRSSTRPSSEQLVVEHRRHGDRERSSSASAQPSRALRSTSTSSAPSSWPFTRTPPPSSCSKSPACKRGANRAELLAELRPEHREIRLHAKLGRVHRSELDLLDAELLRDLVRVTAPPGRAPCTTSRRSGWRSFTPASPRAWRPSSTMRRTSATSSSSASSGRARRAMAPERPTRAPRRRATAPEEVGEEGHHRRDHLHRADQRIPERPECDRVAVPEAAARAADVPVREIVDERLE